MYLKEDYVIKSNYKSFMSPYFSQSVKFRVLTCTQVVEIIVPRWNY